MDIKNENCDEKNTPPDNSNIIIKNEFLNDAHEELLQKSKLHFNRDLKNDKTSSEICEENTLDSDTSLSGEDALHYDCSNMTVNSASDILNCIQSVNINLEELPKYSISQYLEPRDLDVLKKLSQYISDAVLTIEIPQALHYKKGITSSDLIDVYINSVLRITYLMVRNEHYLDCVKSSNTIPLVNLLPALISTSLYIYHHDSKCYAIPSSSLDTPPLMIHISDLLEIFPTQIVTGLTDINKIYAKLNFDWTMTLLSVCSFFFLPIPGYEEKCEQERNKYASLLKKYMTWKFGPKLALKLFGEILKFMDAVQVFSFQMKNIELNINENEIYHAAKRLNLVSCMKENQEVNCSTAICLSAVNFYVQTLLHNELYSTETCIDKKDTSTKSPQKNVAQSKEKMNKSKNIISVSDVNELINFFKDIANQ